MTPREHRDRWVQLLRGIQSNHQGGNINRREVAELAETLLPDWPSFDYTLRLISRTMRA